MRVLVACEWSATVRDEFRKRGHDAWSCDLIDTAGDPAWHIKDDAVAQTTWKHWDLVLAFPPCTHLAVSGARWFKDKQEEQRAAIDFFMRLADADAPRVAIENPIGIMSRLYRKPDQIIQPWQFGHAESKATCLWLKNLPKLRPTNVLDKPACGYWNNQTPSGQNKLGPSPRRAQDRGRTYQGIADAMAEQWGNLEVVNWP